VWPIVRDDEWCSEWKLSESKVYDLGPTGRKPRERPWDSLSRQQRSRAASSLPAAEALACVTRGGLE
jgi:hypothetical protein